MDLQCSLETTFLETRRSQFGVFNDMRLEAASEVAEGTIKLFPLCPDRVGKTTIIDVNRANGHMGMKETRQETGLGVDFD